MTVRERKRSGSVVLITGGSRGLGLALAQECASLGYSVAICARDHQELARAEEIVRSSSAEASVASFVCDVTVPEEISDLLTRVVERFGRLDLLINNAGIILVGPFESAGIDQFESAMKVMFWAPLHTIRAALPHLRNTRGRIVNVTSIGGKVSVPHLLPYSCAKFAAVALSEGLRAELAKDGISVSTIAPGLMRTGSHIHARFHGKQKAEFAWFGLGASLPFLSMSVKRAARQIVRAAELGKPAKTLSLPAQLLDRVHGVAPSFVQSVFALVNQYVLPAPSSTSAHLVEGAQLEPEFGAAYKAVTLLGRQAAREFNER